MSKKLGQTLIDRGVITADDLERALRNQLMLGGHLGTCLLELGLFDEEILGTTLAETLGVSYARPRDLLRADEEAVRSISQHLAEECEAVPFRRLGTSLDVAMINPRDLGAIEALSFASKCRIVPWVAPEIRIFDAMERLYDIPRRTRYVVISRSLPAAGTASDSDPATESGYGRSWVEIADELAAKSPPSGGSQSDDVNSLASQLCRVDDKNEVARAVLAHASKTMTRAMLFAVMGDDVTLWDSAGFAPKPDPGALGTVGIGSLAILDHLLGLDHYRGPLGDSEEHREIYTRLDVAAPLVILLVPVHVNDRLVALFLADGGPEGQALGDSREGMRLARMLGLALNLMIFKRKIRSLGSLARHSPG